MTTKQSRKIRRQAYNTHLIANETSFSKKLTRELCDPNRIYEGRPVDIGAIKAVKLG